MQLKEISPEEAREKYGLGKKDSYEELNETQKEIVDLTAENPDLTQYEITEEHGDITRPYVHKIQRCYPHIIQERREELLEEVDELDRFAEEAESPGQTSNADGEVKTEGGGVSVVGTIDATNQYWDERPVKNQLTQEQEEFINNLSASALEKKVIRAKARNPQKSFKEISRMIDEKLGTVSAYISTNRENIEKVHSLRVKENFEEEEDDADGEFSLTFDDDEVVDLLSSNIDREMKKDILETITSLE